MFKRGTSWRRWDFPWVIWDRHSLLSFSNQERKQSRSHCIFNCKPLFIERAGNCFSPLHKCHNNILRKQNKRKILPIILHPNKSHCFLFPKFRVSEISLGKYRSGESHFIQRSLGLFCFIQKTGEVSPSYTFFWQWPMFTKKNSFWMFTSFKSASPDQTLLNVYRKNSFLKQKKVGRPKQSEHNS